MAFATLAFAFAAACGTESGSGPKLRNNQGPGAASSGGLIPQGDGGAGAANVEAVITCDNAFSFGYGDARSLTTYIRGEGSDGPAIFDCPVGFGPQAYVVPAASAPDGAYLYIIAWADEDVTQGVLAQFKRVGGSPIYSGDGNWEGCAVGTPFEDLGPGPDLSSVNATIAACNDGAAGATFSKGWVTTRGALTPGAIGKLAFGEANDDPGGNFPIVCQKDGNNASGIDAVAKWMWFDPQDGASPFVGNRGNRTQTFLIFRLPAAAIRPAPIN